MKKVLSLLLILTLLLAGCQKPDADTVTADPTEEATENIAQETVPDFTGPSVDADQSVYPQQPMTAVSMPVLTETAQDADGNVYFTHKYQTMQLVTSDPAVADSIIVDFLNRLDALHTTADDLCQQAEAQVSGDRPAYFYHILYSPTRIDRSVLSLSGMRSSYSGSNHSSQSCTAANYNMLTGEVLTLGSILYHADAKQTLVEAVIGKADAIAQDAQLYDDYALSIQDRFSWEESFDEDWYFSSTGLCFFFSPYELAPYSAGVIVLEVPYEELTGIIADEFFPPEADLTEGNLNAQLFSSANVSAYTQIAELLIDSEGEQIFLTTGGAVRDITIELGRWDESATEFMPSCTIFAAAALTPGDGIMVQTSVPDVLPNLRISYRTGEEKRTVYLSQSGEDGSILLLAA